MSKKVTELYINEAISTAWLPSVSYKMYGICKTYGRRFTFRPRNKSAVSSRVSVNLKVGFKVRGKLGARAKLLAAN